MKGFNWKWKEINWKWKDLIENEKKLIENARILIENGRILIEKWGARSRVLSTKMKMSCFFASKNKKNYETRPRIIETRTKKPKK